jgi:hypothetical protein
VRGSRPGSRSQQRPVPGCLCLGVGLCAARGAVEPRLPNRNGRAARRSRALGQVTGRELPGRGVCRVQARASRQQRVVGSIRRPWGRWRQAPEHWSIVALSVRGQLCLRPDDSTCSALAWCSACRMRLRPDGRRRGPRSMLGWGRDGVVSTGQALAVEAGAPINGQPSSGKASPFGSSGQRSPENRIGLWTGRS